MNLVKYAEKGKTEVRLVLSQKQMNLVKCAEKSLQDNNCGSIASAVGVTKHSKHDMGKTVLTPLLMERPIYRGQQGDQVDKSNVSFDAAGGVNINIIDDMNGNAFTTLLQTSISQGRQQGKTHVWLTLPTELENLRKLANKEGFHPRDGSSGTHRLLYLIPHTNHNPQPNVSHVVDIKQGDIIAAANRREENEFELSDKKSVALSLAVQLPEDANVSDNRALYMLPAKDTIGLVLYALVIWLTVVLLRTFYQAAEPTPQIKRMLEASCGSLFGNMVVAALVFAYGRDKPKNKGISFIFNLTLAIPLYLGYSMLMPGWYSWIGFPVICIILTIVEFHAKIRKMFQVIF